MEWVLGSLYRERDSGWNPLQGGTPRTPQVAGLGSRPESSVRVQGQSLVKAGLQVLFQWGKGSSSALRRKKDAVS